MKKNINTYALLLAFGFLAIIGGCKKSNTTSNLEAQRLFKPGSVSVSASQTSAKVTWTNSILTSGQKFKYTAQFSKDTLFSNVAFTLTSDTTGVTATNDSLAVRTKYWVRVKTNAYADQPESKWAESSSFSITGEQYFLTVRDLEVKETSVTLRWTILPGASKITLTPATGTPVDYAITSTEATTGVKIISGLAVGTKYTAELFASSKSKGYTSFTTQTLTLYNTILNSGADINAAIAIAANNDIIGLSPGTYSITTATVLSGKTVTLKSTSGNPSDTKVNFKGFTLLGTGSGIRVSGLDLDGTANSATYFVDLTSASSNAVAAAFNTINADNCYIHGIGTGIIRGDRSSSFSMTDVISFKNCLIYDVTGSSSYYMFHLNKLLFSTLSLSQCTLYNFSPGLITCSTVTATTPTITISACTFNNFGFNSLYILLAAGSNPVSFSVKNSILANTPRSGTVLGIINSTATASGLTFSYNNTFNLFATAGGSALTLPTSGITATNNQTINLGWTAATADFTLPASSALRLASATNSAIGDPRWTY